MKIQLSDCVIKSEKKTIGFIVERKSEKGSWYNTYHATIIQAIDYIITNKLSDESEAKNLMELKNDIIKLRSELL